MEACGNSPWPGRSPKLSSKRRAAVRIDSVLNIRPNIRRRLFRPPWAPSFRAPELAEACGNSRWPGRRPKLSYRQG
eukprot:11404820-Alexandrium_andersonii.AAC.1